MKRRLWWADPDTMDTNPSEATTPLAEPPAGEQPNLVSSLLENGMHAPVIDIDHVVYVIPSSTPGHFHLYIDVEMDFERYDKLLRAMVEAGIVGSGYYEHSMTNRGFTTARLPWVRKGDKSKAQDTVDEIVAAVHEPF